MVCAYLDIGSELKRSSPTKSFESHCRFRTFLWDQREAIVRELWRAASVNGTYKYVVRWSHVALIADRLDRAS